MAQCHTGNPLVFEAHGIRVHAGGNTRQGGWQNMKPRPDVAIGPHGVIRTRNITNSMPTGWSCGTKVRGDDMPELVVIDWPDFGIPQHVGRPFWLALVEDFKSNDIKTVLCSCMGGHGRTGVQLCILAHLMLPKEQHTWQDASQLVTYIRSVYCNHAVEGKSQQQYIADVLEIPVGESLFLEAPVAKFDMSAFKSSGIDYEDLWEDDWEDEKPTKKTKKNKNKKAKSYGKKTLSDFGGRKKQGKNTGGWTLMSDDRSDVLYVHNSLRNEKEFLDHFTVDLNDHDGMETCRSCKADMHPLEIEFDGRCKYCLMSNTGQHDRIRKKGKSAEQRMFLCPVSEKEYPLAFSLVDEKERVVSLNAVVMEEKRNE